MGRVASDTAASCGPFVASTNWSCPGFLLFLEACQTFDIHASRETTTRRSQGLIAIASLSCLPKRRRARNYFHATRGLPAAARHPDRWGRFPFHLACLTVKGCLLLDMLKPHNPEAILQPDGWLELPPVLLAAQSPRATMSNVFLSADLGPRCSPRTYGSID
jgi:hypothetical protein